MKDPSYIVGIDLGTSNTVVAYTAFDENQDEIPDFNIFDIVQISSPGVSESFDALPSFLYIPEANEAAKMVLPWEAKRPVIGTYAKNRGAELPGRQIASSKSWLCSDFIDREEAVLPWDSQDLDKDERLSPLDASAAILEHIRLAWNYHFGEEDKLEDQEIFLTVPASFDALAQELTVRAARKAGFKRLVLLEEPQAAFYSWLAARKDKWREEVKVGDKLLVCDIGGGTSDFSLIEVKDQDGNMALERIAVGKHLLVGGDNMDLALAYYLAARLAASNKKLDSWQMRELIQRCRSAKESLLANPEKIKESLVIAGRGTSLIGSNIKTELSYDEVESLILKGFFPECSKDTLPQQSVSLGISEFGLAYEADPAVTKYLAAFIAQNQLEPTAVLFNGGVMKSPALRKSLLEIISSWQEGDKVRELNNPAGDKAVALGAAYYGWSRKNKGVRIRSGLNRTYYIGVMASMPAIPGIPMPQKALCIAPFGMEEGMEAELKDKTYMLSVGVPVSFDLLASSTRKEDKLGDTVEDWQGEIHSVARIETRLDADGESRVPVNLALRVSEMGTLEFYCVSTKDERSWDLSFQLRDDKKA